MVQMREQPSPLTAFPSSQFSFPGTRILSPQTAVHTLGLPEHVQPLSVVQLAEQPSWESVLASSHCSLPETMPSPQRGAEEMEDEEDDEEEPQPGIG